MPYNAQDNNGQLTLYQITENDAGVYICTGQDQNGNTMTAQAQITGLYYFFYKLIFTRELASSAGLISKIHHLNRDF